MSTVTLSPEVSAPLLEHAANGRFHDLAAAATTIATAKHLSPGLVLVIAKDKEGRGVAHHAALRDHADNRVVIVRALGVFAGVESGLARSFLAAGDNRGNTPLHYAAAEGHAPMVLLMLQSGASANALNRTRETALHAAVRRGEMATIGHLLDEPWGARLNARDHMGRAALHVATRYGDAQVVDWLLTARRARRAADAAAGVAPREATEPAAVTALDNFGNSVLHEAVRSRNVLLVARLAAAGAPVDAQNQFGTTPLHVAATLGDLDTADHLLATCRADGKLRDVRGRTPRELALQFGFQELATLLQHHGF